MRSLKIWLPAVKTGSGADVFVTRLARGLEKAGHLPVIQWFPHKYELMPWRLRKVAPPEDTDIVHTGTWQGFAFKRSGIPLILTEHHYANHPDLSKYKSIAQDIYHRWFIYRYNKLSYAAADSIVAVSEYCAKAMRPEIDRPVSVVHNWIDGAQFHPDKTNAAGEDKPFRLLFAGNPSRRKGADIIPALADKLGSDFEILCLGGLRNPFGQKELRGNMKILPSVVPEAMPGVYRSAHAVLVPTRYEPFGYIALEAMFSGLPVIGFDSSGTAEVCQNGETALLAPLDDVEQLAKFARQLLSDSRLRLSMGIAGRARAEKYFSEEAGISEYLDIYRAHVSG